MRPSRHAPQAASLALIVLSLVSAPSQALGQHVLGGEVIGLGTDDGEVTPDGRFAVTRENTLWSTAVIWDLATGAEVARHQSTGGGVSGSCCDAVAVTDSRAVVIGSSIQVIDLTVPGTARIAEHFETIFPRDVAIDALGRFAIVRGGFEVRVIDLATGAVSLSLFSLTVDPNLALDVDAAVATADHGVATDYIMGAGTGVTIVEFAPSTGGPPRAVYQSPPNERLGGRPHDLAVSPDGLWCGVRSDEEVALYRLDGPNTQLVWKLAPSSPVSPFDDSAMDSIELTDDWLFTMGRSAVPGWTLMEAYDRTGARVFGQVFGDPHDLELSPNRERLVYRTSERFGVVPVASVQIGPAFPLLEVDVHCVVTGFGAGLDSVAATNTHGAAMFVRASGPIARLYRIDGFAPVFEATIPLVSGPIDVEFTPDGTRALFTTLQAVQVYDLRTRTTTLIERPLAGGGWWPWCDGVALNDANAVAFGVGAPNGTLGWTSLLDLFDEPGFRCASGPNSTGAPGVLVATGSSRPSANDLTLWARGLPANAVTLLAYGSVGAPVRFGDGALCLAGPVVGRYVTPVAPANGNLQIALDQNAVSTGAGTFLVGTTWLFQLVHRDPGGVTGFNATNGIAVPFLN